MNIIVWNLETETEEVLIEKITGFLFIDKADLIILTGNRNMSFMKKCLSLYGFKELTSFKSNWDGIFIGCKSELIMIDRNNNGGFWLEALLPVKKLTVLGIYDPDGINFQEKGSLWKRLNEYIRTKSNNRAIVGGTFNITGVSPETIFNFKRYLQSIARSGWVDGWRYFHPVTYEFTWFSSAKKGLQFNFLILSPLLKELLINAYHSTLQLGVKNKNSFAPLIIELRELSNKFGTIIES